MRSNTVFLIFAAAAASVAAQQGSRESENKSDVRPAVEPETQPEAQPEEKPATPPPQEDFLLSLLKPGIRDPVSRDVYCKGQARSGRVSNMREALCGPTGKPLPKEEPTEEVREQPQQKKAEEKPTAEASQRKPQQQQAQAQKQPQQQEGEKKPQVEQPKESRFKVKASQEMGSAPGENWIMKKRDYLVPAQGAALKHDDAPAPAAYKKRDHPRPASSSTCTSTLATVVKPTSTKAPLASSSSCTTTTTAQPTTSLLPVPSSSTSCTTTLATSKAPSSSVPATTQAPITPVAPSSSTCTTTATPVAESSSTKIVPTTTARTTRYVIITAKTSTTEAAPSSSSSVTPIAESSTAALSTTTAHNTRYLTITSKSSTAAVPTTAAPTTSSSVEPAYETSTPQPQTTAAPSHATVSTIYATQKYTITSCAGGQKECSSAAQTFITTHIVPIYTTVCPTSALQPVKPTHHAYPSVKPIGSSAASSVKPVITGVPYSTPCFNQTSAAPTGAASSSYKAVPHYNSTLTSSVKHTHKETKTLAPTYTPSVKINGTTKASYPTGPTAGATTAVSPSKSPMPTVGSGADRTVIGLAALAVPLLFL
ncbi:hypothetical protein PgNI_10713 [Pyricularia grisea]|uniref:Uncharacterized protein n=1 Tax=Pyricularia grisea TaxID=148305 RepID=A0A6P8AYN4_PYRGI|nr:hypothetical protein PgNI_10713 [Pyricularia grisea]TLD07404.1 hypothetical protein PgNI_10713 [Pyricularia grisea]